MIKLETLSSEGEARIKKDYLLSHGIICAVLGAKNYASFVVGGEGQGKYTLMVAEEDLAKAQKLLRKANLRTITSEEAQSAAAIVAMSQPRASRLSYFKKALLYALLAPLVFPIVFNIASLKQGWLDWEYSDKGNEAKLRWALIWLAHVPTWFILKMMLGQMSQMFSAF